MGMDITGGVAVGTRTILGPQVEVLIVTLIKIQKDASVFVSHCRVATFSESRENEFFSRPGKSQ